MLPVFDVLDSREGIIQHRAEYPSFDEFGNHLILLEEAMIFGRCGDVEKASRVFKEYYKNNFDEYTMNFEHGIKTYLHKGEKMLYRNTKTDETETIIADKDGYYIVYNANRSHLDYLVTLAEELGIVLCAPDSYKLEKERSYIDGITN